MLDALEASLRQGYAVPDFDVSLQIVLSNTMDAIDESKRITQRPYSRAWKGLDHERPDVAHAG